MRASQVSESTNRIRTSSSKDQIAIESHPGSPQLSWQFPTDRMLRQYQNPLTILSHPVHHIEYRLTL